MTDVAKRLKSEPVAEPTTQGWELLRSLSASGITFGPDALRERVSSGSFMKAMHAVAFRFANDVPTIGTLPWRILGGIDVPKAGATAAGPYYSARGMVAGVAAGFQQPSFRSE